MQIEVLSTAGSRSISRLDLDEGSTVADIKKGVHRVKKDLYPDRQAVRLEVRGKTLKDSDTLKGLGLQNGSKVYVKDLGPQIGWSTVFLCEYAGPLFTYLLFYIRPSIIYGQNAADQPYAHVVNVAALCWSFHYAKRLYETVFVHRFSHATMPIMNLFKNCSYYWGFAAFVSYHVNHPKYTVPCLCQAYLGLAIFALCEIGNYGVHVALRNLRPPGTKERRIPVPTSNSFTKLFDFVSCPNYTYEIGSWIGFTLLTSTLAAALFTIAGGYQMAMWALGKHRNYKKEFPDYPRSRKAIFPLVL